MSRRKRGHRIHGWVVLDKPLGMTSTRAVSAVRRLFDAQKAGHAGTLDPLATGVLPIALGEATKTVPFAVDGEKVYRFTVRWGAETTTDDAEGEVIDRREMRPERADVEALLARFQGVIMQVPPKFSAIKVEGARAYDLAREGEDVVLEPREVRIEALSLVECPDADTAVFKARCGKGTYVRALARDMGRELGALGHVVALRREEVGPFNAREAVTLDALEAAVEDSAGAGLEPFLRPVETALEGLAGLMVSSSDAASLARGQSVLMRGRDAPILSGPVYAVSKGRLVALGEIDRGTLKPTRVFNLAE